MHCLVADDHPLVLSGLRQILKELKEISQVHEAVSYPMALEALDQNPSIGLLLLDLAMPGSPGLAGIDQVRSQHPTVGVVIISANEDPQVVREALARGALGYIPKSVSGEVVLSALRLVLAGERYVPQGWLLDVLKKNHPRAADPLPQLPQLTTKQKQVVALLCQGLSNARIAEELSVAEQTVKNHLQRIYKILGVSNRSQALIKVTSAADFLR